MLIGTKKTLVQINFKSPRSKRILQFCNSRICLLEYLLKIADSNKQEYNIFDIRHLANKISVPMSTVERYLRQFQDLSLIDILRINNKKQFAIDKEKVLGNVPHHVKCNKFSSIYRSQFENLINLDGISEKFLAKRIMGIYFLYRGEDIVYIGKALNVMRRIPEHLGVKDFDSYSYKIFDCSPGDLEIIETMFIKKYNPLLNITHAE